MAVSIIRRLITFHVDLIRPLSEKHTENHGHRLVDTLHVATALHFGAEQFLTFDANQKRLAEAEGMQVPV